MYPSRPTILIFIEYIHQGLEYSYNKFQSGPQYSYVMKYFHGHILIHQSLEYSYMYRILQ